MRKGQEFPFMPAEADTKQPEQFGRHFTPAGGMQIVETVYPGGRSKMGQVVTEDTAYSSGESSAEIIRTARTDTRVQYMMPEGTDPQAVDTPRNIPAFGFLHTDQVHKVASIYCS